MKLKRIVAATDESEASRQAVRAALDIGRRSSGRVLLLHVVTAPVLAPFNPALGNGGSLALEDQRPTSEELSIAYGVPGIEICRFAEDRRADLIVLGRKKHCERSRLLLGDTGDAVARRSRVPCLLVPPEGVELRRILVALDGSPRGMSVLEHACDIAQAVAASVEVLTVEHAPVRQFIPNGTPPLTRGASLQRRVSDCLIGKGMSDTAVTIRNGNVPDEVLAEVVESRCDILAIGHHRGGQPWAVQAGSTAQRLSHAAPCAVLTIPL